MAVIWTIFNIRETVGYWFYERDRGLHYFVRSL